MWPDGLAISTKVEMAPFILYFGFQSISGTWYVNLRSPCHPLFSFLSLINPLEFSLRGSRTPLDAFTLFAPVAARWVLGAEVANSCQQQTTRAWPLTWLANNMRVIPCPHYRWMRKSRQILPPPPKKKHRQRQDWVGKKRVQTIQRWFWPFLFLWLFCHPVCFFSEMVSPEIGMILDLRFPPFWLLLSFFSWVYFFGQSHHISTQPLLAFIIDWASSISLGQTPVLYRRSRLPFEKRKKIKKPEESRHEELKSNKT